MFSLAHSISQLVGSRDIQVVVANLQVCSCPRLRRAPVIEICLVGSIHDCVQLACRRHLRLPSFPEFLRRRVSIWVGSLR
jgi:hypothetical protein